MAERGRRRRNSKGRGVVKERGAFIAQEEGVGSLSRAVGAGCIGVSTCRRCDKEISILGDGLSSMSRAPS